jgi:RNA polymerase sigma-70 factor, ECF subfamily
MPVKNIPKRIAKAQKGDIKAFHQVFSTFQDQLKSFLYRLITDRNDVEDIVQETFVKAFDKIKTYKGKSSPKTWVFAIATNLARDLIRKRKRWPLDALDQACEAYKTSPHLQEKYAMVAQHTPYNTFVIREHIDFCFTCISKTLPIEQQLALILKDIYEFKVKEIGLILDRSMGMVKHLLHDARTSMVRIFDNRCALVNKNGTCHQCSELNGIFNPEQDARQALLKIEMVKEGSPKDKADLFKLRARLVKGIDPLSAEGANLHEFMMQNVRLLIGETGGLHPRQQEPVYNVKTNKTGRKL